MDHIETRIRERAYALWERDGRLDGRDAHYWTLAEQELRGASAAPESDAARVSVAEAPAAEAPVTEAAAKPVRKPAARKPAARKAAAETPAAKAVVKAVADMADMAEAVAKPAPRRRRPAAEAVTTH
ncbi:MULTISPECIES: DUF2934 domain-containing protein [Methylobacterium]|jgi:hypothetical protein|uniref:DUF2934 domain-containing protein n=2 Tax=Methylobacteriaceae TaxID=119045 RepID=UPI0008F239F7|nr:MULTISPECIES: DUF2934 domain-containing protein [Methylobacterium]MBK3398610.1 DUF2934 domain-containing protein [Methylobacterium ajmalii]MBK3409536.1 DUF2934 domain-containing protein [Methylobacterium ajmalii]MBZ6413200.1 DUF2934 domain-containing protein [Methylobacterium sp.]SFF43285.1 Protein of unknown function [Methylobacterium sp. yr596]